MSSGQVMRSAQGLYERGYITYMRTDSVTLSDEAITAARTQVRELYGERFVPDQPRRYKSKVKNAQEAHEAIRPAGERWRTPDQLSTELRGPDLRLYDLIWKRTLASQMADATGKSVSVRIEAPFSRQAESGTTEWAASGRTITFPGYLRVYVEGSDDPEADLDDRERLLPELAEGQVLPDPTVDPFGHTTQPPARYTEASLVKKLEELGIGRPSTYASIMQTIQDRGYVWKKGQALVPSWTAFAVINLLEGHFTAEVDYSFTARMESDLDEIAAGERDRVPFLRDFWFGTGADAGVADRTGPGASGNGSGPGHGGSGRTRPTAAAGTAQRAIAESPGLVTLIDYAKANADPAVVNAIPLAKDETGEEIVVRNGRYGPYIRRGDETATVPADIAPDELTLVRALELLAAPKGDDPIGNDPATGRPVYVKNGRFGPTCSWATPRPCRRARSPRWRRCSRTCRPRPWASTTRCACSACPGWSATTPRAARPSRRSTGATGPTSARAATRGAWATKPSCSRSRSTRRSGSSPSPSAGAARPPRRRCASWATTR